jgi:hypothetical protein
VYPKKREKISERIKEGRFENIIGVILQKLYYRLKPIGKLHENISWFQKV